MEKDKSIRVYCLIDKSTSLNVYASNVKEAIIKMIEAIKSNYILEPVKVFITISYFNSEVDDVIVEKPVNDIRKDEIEYEPCGITDLGYALSYVVQKATKQYENDKEHVSNLTAEQVGIEGELYHPLIVLFTDGRPDAGVGSTTEQQNNFEQKFRDASVLIKENEKALNLAFLALSFGNEANHLTNKEKIQELTNDIDKVYDCSDLTGLEKFFSEQIPTCIIEMTSRTVIDTYLYSDR